MCVSAGALGRVCGVPGTCYRPSAQHCTTMAGHGRDPPTPVATVSTSSAAPLPTHLGNTLHRHLCYFFSRCLFERFQPDPKVISCCWKALLLPPSDLAPSAATAEDAQGAVTPRPRKLPPPRRTFSVALQRLPIYADWRCASRRAELGVGGRAERCAVDVCCGRCAAATCLGCAACGCIIHGRRRLHAARVRRLSLCYACANRYCRRHWRHTCVLG